MLGERRTRHVAFFRRVLTPMALKLVLMDLSLYDMWLGDLARIPKHARPFVHQSSHSISM